MVCVDLDRPTSFLRGCAKMPNPFTMRRMNSESLWLVYATINWHLKPSGQESRKPKCISCFLDKKEINCQCLTYITEKQLQYVKKSKWEYYNNKTSWRRQNSLPILKNKGKYHKF